MSAAASTMPSLPAFTSADALPELRMHWLQAPFSAVVELYKSQVLKVQRHHVRRAASAKHLTEFDLPVHMNYLVARTPDGTLRLVDGYTRITAILNKNKPAPQSVWIGLVDCDSPAAMEQMYNTVDSKQAVKRGRDAFEEGLRRAGLLHKVQSPIFVRGQAVSAIVAATGTSDVRKATWEMRHAIAALDSLNLGAGRSRLPAGALAGLMLLANKEKDKESVQKFAVALEHPEAIPKAERAALSGAIRCAKELGERRAQGALSGKNVGPLMEMVLGCWAWQVKGGKGTPHPVTRADYLTTAG